MYSTVDEVLYSYMYVLRMLSECMSIIFDTATINYLARCSGVKQPREYLQVLVLQS